MRWHSSHPVQCSPYSTVGHRYFRVWRSFSKPAKVIGRTKEEDRLTTRLEAEIGYGLYGADGIYTPYTGLGLVDNGSRDYAVGIRYAGEAALSLGLELNRLEKNDTSPDHRIMLTGQIDW